MNRHTEPVDDEIQSDELPAELRRRRATDSFWNRAGGILLKWLLTGTAVTVILTFTNAIKDEAMSDKALADVVALAAEHDRKLSAMEADKREAAMLRREYDQHVREQSEAHTRIEKRQDRQEAELQELEQRMYSIAGRGL